MSERKPVEAWQPYLSGAMTLRNPWLMAMAWPNGVWSLEFGPQYIGDILTNGKAADMVGGQLAAEDALFAIADAINELRGKK